MRFLFTVFAALLLQSVGASTKPKVCPILGPSFPHPSKFNSSKTFQNALQILDQQLDTALKNGSSEFGYKPFKSQTFSLSVYSTYDDGLLWQRHYTDASVANSPVGTHEVDADTVYRIGSVSKLLTMYIGLILKGDQYLNDPISKYLPELVAQDLSYKGTYGILPKWDQITVGDLFVYADINNRAAHLGGIVADYGDDDIEFPNIPRGFPPLPKDRIPTCGYQIGQRFFTCTKEEELKGLAHVPAIFADAATPSYSNLGYDIISFVIEKMTGVPFAQSFNNFCKSLNLTRTFWSTPQNLTYAAIPVSGFSSGWKQELGPSNADGGNTVSSNDLATIGKSIMGFTLLPKSVTRRWLKPVTFTGDPTNFNGRPWEIYRWETPSRIYDSYTKEGGIGKYSTMFGLVPDLDFGFTVLTTGKEYRQDIEETLANIVAAATLPAVEEIAREQAEANFAGHYTSSVPNSSVVITTDDQPGLKITQWIYNSTNIMERLGGAETDFRLWPNDLYTSGDQVGFSATWAPLVQTAGYIKRPLKVNCESWVGPGFTLFGNVDVGAFVFNIDPSGVATSLELKAFNTTLKK